MTAILISIVAICIAMTSVFIPARRDDKHRCCNGGKLHKFEARYDEKEIISSMKMSRITPEDARRLTIYEIYVKDVCVWCGKEIKR